jgi:PPOX class probable F420-dependent enzyme
MFARHPDVLRRLAEEPIIWLTTVRPNGQPQTSPVWFLMDDDEVLVYSRPAAAKVANITDNPRVALNLDGNGRGGAVITLEGRARLVPQHDPADAKAPYVEKYAAFIARNGWTPRSFAADYSLPIRIELHRLRAW